MDVAGFTQRRKNGSQEKVRLRDHVLHLQSFEPRIGVVPLPQCEKRADPAPVNICALQESKGQKHALFFADGFEKVPLRQKRGPSAKEGMSLQMGVVRGNNQIEGIADHMAAEKTALRNELVRCVTEKNDVRRAVRKCVSKIRAEERPFVEFSYSAEIGL